MKITVSSEVAIGAMIDQRLLASGGMVPVGTSDDDDGDAVLDWLARLRLLDGVPFEYLVPDAGLLQSETIRFFHLDRGWTDAAADGALAAGTYGTRDRAALQAAHATIRAATDDAERTVWGTTPRSGTTPQITGFLLRSRAVSGWPGLTVRAYATARADGPQLQTLRIERLSPSVLVALFDDEPKLVVIEEPRQGVQFGVRSHASGGGRTILPIRDPADDTRVGPDTVDVPYRRGSTGVLHLTELRSRLAGELGTTPTALTSADLAYQLLRLPYQQRFGPGARRPPKLTELLDVVIGVDELIEGHS